MKAAVTSLVFAVAALLSLGLVILYSSSMMQTGAHFLTMQLIWCGVGIVGCLIMASLDYAWLKRTWPLLLGGAAILLLAVVTTRLGMKINGARRWLSIPGLSAFRIQPSEFAKIALLVFLASYGERFQRQMGTIKKGVLIPGIFICVTLALIFIEPDRGTTILLASVSAMVLLTAGTKWYFIFPPVVLAAAGLVVSFIHDPLRSDRIHSWLNLEATRTGTGHQAYQAMIALGAGGLTGLGLGNGRQKFGFVPEHRTDFIFSIIGEELGFIATIGVLIAFIVILVCGLVIACRARDIFGSLLAAGITYLIGLQALINIGVVTGALPNKGLSLPFISYGGSNLLAMLLLVGILLSVARFATPAPSETGVKLVTEEQ